MSTDFLIDNAHFARTEDSGKCLLCGTRSSPIYFYILPHFSEGAKQDHSVASRMIYMRIFVCTCIISRICSGRMATEINTNSRHEQRYSSRNSFRKNILLPAGTMRRFNEYFPDERQPTLIRISTELWTGYNYRK